MEVKVSPFLKLTSKSTVGVVNEQVDFLNELRKNLKILLQLKEKRSFAKLFWLLLKLHLAKKNCQKLRMKFLMV